MKARTKNGQIKIYKSLPSEYTKDDGTVILNFRNATDEVLTENGFYDVVKPSYNPMTQTKGGLYFDEANSIVTYDVTDIDFDQNIDILDEDGEPTGETENRYKIADIKASKIAEIKSKAGKMLEPTDWQVIRKVERDIDIDTDVATERAGILTEADRLEAEVNVFTTYADVLQYKVQFFPI
jgi:triacylglycerol esterase/lipase EstA (alpha/beta hydrolase family)